VKMMRDGPGNLKLCIQEDGCGLLPSISTNLDGGPCDFGTLAGPDAPATTARGAAAEHLTSRSRVLRAFELHGRMLRVCRTNKSSSACVVCRTGGHSPQPLRQ
jgi:hypothetical protein